MKWEYPLHKDDMQICEASHTLKKKKEKKRFIALTAHISKEHPTIKHHTFYHKL